MSLIPHLIEQLERQEVAPVHRHNNTELGQKLDKPIKCCDKLFWYQKPYLTHLDHHVQCDICSYSACRRTLNEHFMKAHCNLIQLNTPEEIEKWREARRQNFPTKNKIIKKRQYKLNIMKEKAKQYRLEELNKRTNEEEIDMECSDDEIIEVDAKTPVDIVISPLESFSSVIEYKILQVIEFMSNK